MKTILRLASDLNLATTAEGIEHAGQRDILAALNCATAQGYLMSRPLPVAALESYIASADCAQVVEQ